MPEIQKLIAGKVDEEYPTELYRQNYDPGLDTLHEALVEDYVTLGLSKVFDPVSSLAWDEWLPNSYYTNGSSEGLFHLIARHKTHFPNIPLYQFEGEYQGYEEYAKALGLHVNTVRHGQDISKLRPGVFILSVPSAVDGNAVGQSVIDRIGERHYMILDCAYAGMADMEGRKLALNDRVAAVVGSMSKPFGLYYHRIGFLWSRDPVPSLYGNKWFKNIFSIQVGNWVLDDFDAHFLAVKYRPWQKRACEEASNHLGVKVQPSDVWLLGHVLPNADEGLPVTLAPFQRGPGYRMCLTPYYMAYERES